MDYKEELLQEMIEKAHKIAFLGGAGVSTESGIPDFRSETGIYNMKKKYGVSYEEILSHSYFFRHPDIFYDFYKTGMIYKDAKPNLAHKALAKLENEGKDITIITQNIDGLHQKAGSKKVIELHGSVYRNHCTYCHKPYDIDYILNYHGVPICKDCGHVIKPDVVLYEEPLDEEILYKAIKAIREADLLIVCGTSLNVYPAAGLINYYQRSDIVLINKSATSLDKNATLVISKNAGDVLADVAEL